jgi:hypothetical protein
VKTGKPADEHAARDLTHLRERCAITEIIWSSCGPTDDLPPRRRNRARRDPRARPKRSGAAPAVALRAGSPSAVALGGGRRDGGPLSP